MPTLDWIGKKAVEKHHLRVPYRLLKDVPALSCGDPGTGNLIVQGDNLLALKALLPFYAGQVKCIYIDPPYNTGQDRRDEEGKRTGWIYSDNVSSPVIRAWLGKVVGAEFEDLSRHDKWLCMIYPRLSLLRQMLRADGVIFISIDEIELASLRFIMDEIFGAGNRVGTIVWKNATDNNPTQIATEHEYVICYALDKNKLPKEWKSSNLAVKERLLEIGADYVRQFPNQEERQAAYSKWFREHKAELWPFQDYKFIDGGGIYTGMRSVHNPGKEGYRYDVNHPVTNKPCQEPMMGYRFPEETMKQLLEENRIIFGDDETKIIELKVYAKEYRAKLSSLYELDGRVGTNEIKSIFPESKRPFDFPKPTELIEELISFVTSGDDIVLDSFAGSGVTGQAVLQLNRADGGRRKYILTEMEPDICRNVTAERLRRVISGDKATGGKAVSGIGGGFRYCELGGDLFDELGQIRESVTFGELARHVWFTEFHEPLPRERVTNSPFLGECNGVGLYLLYNGILGDKSASGGNVLTRAILERLPAYVGPKVIYCAGNLLGADRLLENRVTIRQTPYEIKAN